MIQVPPVMEVQLISLAVSVQIIPVYRVVAGQ
jgi:hypothetical protein